LLSRPPSAYIYTTPGPSTPGDACRYWLADTYEARHAAGEEPQNIDKEFLRLWFRENCDPYHDKVKCHSPQFQKSTTVSDVLWSFISAMVSHPLRAEETAQRLCWLVCCLYIMVAFLVS
jgi:hypothetical protein